MNTVPTEDFEDVMVKIRDLRRWATSRRLDPWAFRQALLVALEIDTQAALEHGISMDDLAKFDDLARQDIRRWLKGSRYSRPTRRR
jgi:hypothetical protein